MALNMSDDEDILPPPRLRRVVGRQPFQQPDEEEDRDIMDLATDSDEAEQVQNCTQYPEHQMGDISSQVTHSQHYPAWKIIVLATKSFLQDADHGQPAHRRDRIPLHHFLRLIGGGRVIERDAAATNDELVSALKRRGIITQ